MDDESAGHWVEPPLLPTAPAPPLDRIRVRGARLVRVYAGTESRDVAGKPRRDGGREAVTLAWARMPDGGWAVLLAWAGHWAYDSPPHQTEAARWSWCRYDEERVQPRRPPQVLYDGAAWHGWAIEGELNRAIGEAVASLPGRLRETAIRPAEQQGPAES